MNSYLWIKTKELSKSEDGFKVDSLDHAKEMFAAYKARWDKIQLDQNEKTYTFTAKFEDEDGNFTKI